MVDGEVVIVCELLPVKLTLNVISDAHMRTPNIDFSEVFTFQMHQYTQTIFVIHASTEYSEISILQHYSFAFFENSP